MGVLYIKLNTQQGFFISTFPNVAFLQIFKCLFCYTKAWTNKKLSDWLAHRVSLQEYWASLGQRYTIGKPFQRGGFIN